MALKLTIGGQDIIMPSTTETVLLKGGTMTGALTLNDAPTTANGAATKKYVDDEIAELESKALVFTCFVSVNEPQVDVRPGNMWYKPAAALTVLDENFPWPVYTADENAVWSTTTTDYTPAAFDVVTNLDVTSTVDPTQPVKQQYLMDLSSQCNGTLTAFTLTETVSNSTVVHNGLILQPGATNDYTITSTTLTYTGTAIPVTGDKLFILYWK